MKIFSFKTLLWGCIGIMSIMSSCRDEGDSVGWVAPVDENAVEVTRNITASETWTSDKTYVLKTRISVESGATLTIEPGTIIKGDVGSGPNATALIIARGAKIIANGTATLPIIFTSSADNIESGQVESPNFTDPTYSGLWGGLIILGNAPISADAPAMQIEGIPPSDANGLYGGTDEADNSGELSYVSIRHGGANIGEGNEINGLTLGGVGSATKIHHIEIISIQDDGIEFFGGSVDVSDLVIYAAGDDAVDVDQAWSGTLDNFIVICEGTDHGLEIDGPEGSLIQGGVVKNGSIRGDEDAELADFRDAAAGRYENLYFFQFADPMMNDRGDFSLSSGSDLTFEDGLLKFSHIEVSLPDGVALDDVLKGGVDAYATAVPLGENTVGADKSVFASWSLVDAIGLLDEFN